MQSLAMQSKQQHQYVPQGDVPLAARSHKHITQAGVQSTAMPFMVIPLPNPEQLLPLVSTELKMQCMDSFADSNDKNMCFDDAPLSYPADAEPTSKTPLFHFDRAWEFYEELFWMTYAGSCLDCTPGNGTACAVSASMGMPITAIAKNDTHKSVMLDGIKDIILRRMNDPLSAQYISDTDLGLAAAPSTDP